MADKFYGKTLNIKKPKVCLALGIATTYIIIIAVLVVCFTYFIPQVTNSITELILNSDTLYKKGEAWLNDFGEKVPILDTEYIQNKIEQSFPQLISFGTDFVKNVFPKILNASISIAKTAINILLSIAISIYMIYDKRMLSKNSARVIYAFVPKKKADTFLDVTRECGSIFTGFIVGKTIDSTIIGILCFILMSILKLPYAILISVIVGVTNMIPYFGPFIGAVPGILLYLFMSPIQALVFAIMILALQQFDGWILGPKILGDSTGLTPLWVIFGITVGGAYGGVIGMFLGVPFVAVIAYLSDMLITGRLKKRNIEIR
ncbi:MAG TPA: AI-2E family transporter [Lachnoclostridium phytofermentans]|uniref:AI-2E family transporter n=1 Tax=Lachnoclostridium phytofermentans TaxID=66219 RepID=A0A3D2X5E9_9FIRM|nr:AI-2E family transporter [Lachnoclostridium phytofermentans]